MPLTTITLAAVPKIIAIPVVATLVLGTGAVSAYVTEPTPVSVSAMSDAAIATPTIAVQPAAQVPCVQQTWPYIERRCAVESNRASRTVRVVMTPSQSDAANLMGAVPAPHEAIEEANKSILMTSRTTVLRGSELAPTPKAVAPKVSNVSVTKPRAKHAETQRDRRVVAQSYQVPADYGMTSRAVVVVRPMRTEAYE